MVFKVRFALKISASIDVVKKIVPEGTGWVTGSAAYGGTIAQKISKIKSYESLLK
jgi:hypothetical protein